MSFYLFKNQFSQDIEIDVIPGDEKVKEAQQILKSIERLEKTFSKIIQYICEKQTLFFSFVLLLLQTRVFKLRK
jgi:DNA-directed RNA polymerase specialized sigma54-like protein